MAETKVTGATNRGPLKGHGARSNPPGRFEKHTVETVDDGWYQAEVPDSLPISIQPERARSLITTNDSPDIPFEQSINAYRGCAHACTYCLRGDTLILMGDGSARPIAQVDVGSEIYGTICQGGDRRYVRTRVLDRWSVIQPAHRIVLADGTELVAGGDHRFLTRRGWQFVTGNRAADRLRRPHLTIGSMLLGTGRFATEVPKDPDYKWGYLYGLLRGEAAGKGAALIRAHGYLRDLQAVTRESRLQAVAGPRREMIGIRAAGGLSAERIRTLVAWPPAATPSWCAGFLAGLVDAEGDCNGTLRVCSADQRLIERIASCLDAHDLRCAIEREGPGAGMPVHLVRLLGGLREHLRFLHTIDPVGDRWRDIEGRAVAGDASLRVVSIEPAGTMRLYDMSTGTADFVANGVISHNCYARPSHAYVGLSPGLDFETKLFFKQDAARLLERELSRPGYVCKPIHLGANTDPYQPIERRMRVTRDILEVLVRCRHPLTLITKGALVLRDLDLLARLAHDRLVSVGISITTLDDGLKRAMEPQAASPRARLQVVRALSRAGVPTGVLIAPVIPALTDHEMESILEAAAGAGAGWATYILLRLPYEVKDLFQEWLSARYPDRAEHVMSLVRQMRGGRDNDPRFGSRMRGSGLYAELLRSRFHVACRRLGLDIRRSGALEVGRFTAPRAQPQLSLDL